MAAGPIVYSILILSFVLALQAFRASFHDYRRRGRLPYPPGPRRLPIIGNLLNIPTESSWLAYTRLAKKYGTSSYVPLNVCYSQISQEMLCLSKFSDGSSSY